MRLLLTLILVALTGLLPVHAQTDAVELPAELYVLLNTGQIERYGLGVAGVTQVTDGSAEIIDFGVAPDGALLALRTASGLTLLNMVSGEQRQLETLTAGFPPFRGQGQSVAWSPDGRALAYTVESGIRVFFADNQSFVTLDVLPPVMNLLWSEDGGYLAAESEGNIWWVFRREPAAMVLHAALPSSIGAAWVDPTVLMFAPADGGLFLMDVGAANAQAQIADASTLYSDPALRPDRSVNVFGRGRTDSSTTTEQGYLHTAAFDAAAGWRVERVSDVAVDLVDMRWTPDGRLLVVLRGGVIAVIDPASAQGFTLPATGAVAYEWGAVRSGRAASIAPSADGYFLQVDYTGERQIWLVPRDGSPPTPVTASETSIERFAVAPDGASLAYYSAGALYALPAEVATAQKLIDLPRPPEGITFSADGQTVYYDDESGVFGIPVTGEGGVAVQVLPGYSAPQQISGGLLVRLPDGDLALFNVETRDVRRLGAFRDARILRDGTIAASGRPQGQEPDGIYLLDPAGNAPPLLLVASGANRAVADFVQMDSGLLRLVIAPSDGLPAPVDVVEIAPSGGNLRYIAGAGFILNPRLTGDGQFIAGAGNGSGLLVIHDIAAGQSVGHQLTPTLSQFTWVRLR